MALGGLGYSPTNEKMKINKVVLSFRKFALRGFLLLPRRARLAFLQLVTKWIIEKLLSVPCQDIGQGHIQGTNVLSQYDLVRGEPLNPLKAKRKINNYSSVPFRKLAMFVCVLVPVVATNMASLFK